MQSLSITSAKRFVYQKTHEIIKEDGIMKPFKNIWRIWPLTPYQIKNTFSIIFSYPLKSAYAPEITSTHKGSLLYRKNLLPTGAFYVSRSLMLAA